MGAKPAFVNINHITRIHLMGIGGAGMSGLAQLLKEMGKVVSGCDTVHSCYAEKIVQQGVPVVMGHHEEHLDRFDPELVIFTSAIADNHPEIQAARIRGISVAKRAEVLSEIFNSKCGVGVAGTHGKTTTSSMISTIAEEAECSATVIIGGELCDIGCNAKLGIGKYIIAELDESDGSFELFKPEIAVVTNIDWDHIDYYPSFGAVCEAFSRFAHMRKNNAPLIVCADDAGVSRLIAQGILGNLCTYGWGTGWDWGATDLQYIPGGGMTYKLCHQGEIIGKVSLEVSGEHNVLNSLAACAAAHYMGIDPETCIQALARFKGAKRRLQHVGSYNEVDIYDDYGHHPREIAATLDALDGIYPHRPKIVVFQPHRYTRTAALYKEFAEVLCRADKVYLLPIYSSDESPAPGVNSSLILNEIECLKKNICELCGDFTEIVSRVSGTLKEGDLVLTIGAGDIGNLGEKILKGIR